MARRSSSLFLFKFSGVSVYLHWSWFLVALIEIERMQGRYSSAAWNTIEYIALFLIVLMHEFGHALACRQVGGRADTIMLWPLGGIAFVSPPPRPGAVLWSIAAGPLVNVFLFFVLSAALWWGPGSFHPQSDPAQLLLSIWYINLGLLIFNMLPVYPLDGGQILRSLLWFVMGPSRSLMVSSLLGGAGTIGFMLFALFRNSIWLLIISLFLLSQCARGFRMARLLRQEEKAPRRPGFACPFCRAAPIMGRRWVCGACRTPFDTFETGAICPNCGKQFDATKCTTCGKSSPINAWKAEAGAS